MVRCGLRHGDYRWNGQPQREMAAKYRKLQPDVFSAVMDHRIRDVAGGVLTPGRIQIQPGEQGSRSACSQESGLG